MPSSHRLQRKYERLLAEKVADLQVHLLFMHGLWSYQATYPAVVVTFYDTNVHRLLTDIYVGNLRHLGKSKRFLLVQVVLRTHVQALDLRSNRKTISILCTSLCTALLQLSLIFYMRCLYTFTHSHMFCPSAYWFSVGFHRHSYSHCNSSYSLIYCDCNAYLRFCFLYTNDHLCELTFRLSSLLIVLLPVNIYTQRRYSFLRVLYISIFVPLGSFIISHLFVLFSYVSLL